jgi:hypothetical protein
MTHFHTNVETPWVENLDEYAIPTNVQQNVDVHSQLRDFNPWKVKSNYKQRLHQLLWGEEAQGKKNIRQYDLRGITFEKIIRYEQNGRVEEFEVPLMRLEVPGLAEKRPSVLYRDTV